MSLLGKLAIFTLATLVSLHYKNIAKLATSTSGNGKKLVLINTFCDEGNIIKITVLSYYGGGGYWARLAESPDMMEHRGIAAIVALEVVGLCACCHWFKALAHYKDFHNNFFSKNRCENCCLYTKQLKKLLQL